MHSALYFEGSYEQASILSFFIHGGGEKLQFVVRNKHRNPGGGGVACSLFANGGDRMKFFTRANIAVPRTLEKRFPASFSKASRKRKKRNYPPRLKRLDMKISVEQVYIYILYKIFSASDKLSIILILIIGNVCAPIFWIRSPSGEGKIGEYCRHQSRYRTKYNNNGGR